MRKQWWACAVLGTALLGGCCLPDADPRRDASRLNEKAIPHAATVAEAKKISVEQAQDVVSNYEKQSHWLWGASGYRPMWDRTDDQLWTHLHMQIFTGEKSAYLIQDSQVILEIHPAPAQWGVADVMGDGRAGLAWMSHPDGEHAAPTFGAWSPGVGLASVGMRWGWYSPLPELVAIPGDQPAVYSSRREGVMRQIVGLRMTKPARQRQPSLNTVETGDQLMHWDYKTMDWDWRD